LNETSKREDSRYLLGAMAAPVTQAASNCSWLVALSVGTLCMAIALGLEKLEVGNARTRFLAAVQWLWMLLVISEFLHWTMLCWPNHKNYYVVPLLILLLAAVSASKGREAAARAVGILFWVLAALLGTVLLSGIKEIKLENLMTQWKMQTAYLVLVMLIPVMGIGIGKTKQKKDIVIYGWTVAAVTSGVLSLGLIERMHAPFYEMSKSLSLLGVGQRFESLVAAAMTMGYFALTSYLLTISANAWDGGVRTKRSVWISAAFSALVFLSGMRMNSRLLALGSLAIWALFPMVEKISKNRNFSLDK